MTTAPDALAGAPSPAPCGRIASIDAVRGLVMLLMLVDHVREFFYVGHQVADPMDVATTPPALFFSRLATHLCAPVFVALTGLSAWLYAQRRSAGAAAGFLVRRGLFLVLLEVTVVNFAWTFAFPPTTLYLQVIWAIGLSMLALAALVRLPRGAVAAIGVAIVLGHNLLDPVTVAPGTPGHAAWAILHERGWIDLGPDLRARTSYPVLPWIGVIALGWSIGPWFDAAVDDRTRRRRLIGTGAALLVAFAVIRGFDRYGETRPRLMNADGLVTAMSFLDVTKYPPSLDFLLLTLGLGAVALGLWQGRRGGPLATIGGAPLFFYLLHLYALHLLLLAWRASTGKGGDVPSVDWVWAIAIAATPPLAWITGQFAFLKRRSNARLLQYL